jgi:uncharacterized membrane protein
MFLKVLFSIVLLATGLQLEASTKYEVTEIVLTYPNGKKYGEAIFPTHINGKGQVVGVVKTDNGDLPFYWDSKNGGHLINLKEDTNSPLENAKTNDLQYTFYNVTGFNDHGQMVGIIYTESQDKGFIWDQTEGFRYLQIDAETAFKPTSINNNGQILGFSSPKDTQLIADELSWNPKPAENRKSYICHPCSGFQEIKLNLEAEIIIFPQFINDRSQVVFVTFKLNDRSEPLPWYFYLWEKGELISPPMDAFNKIYPIALNNNGEVAACSVIYEQRLGSEVFFWSNKNKIFENLFLNLDVKTYIRGMNDHSQMVGEAVVTPKEGFAFIYDRQNGFVDLNKCIDSEKSNGAFLKGAYSLNNSGQILTYGTAGTEQSDRAFVLTPISFCD